MAELVEVECRFAQRPEVAAVVDRFLQVLGSLVRCTGVSFDYS